MRTSQDYLLLAVQHRAEAELAATPAIRRLHLSLAEAYDELAALIVREPDTPC